MKAITRVMIMALATAGISTAANASVSISVSPGCAVYCGATPITYDYNSAAGTPIELGGAVETSSSPNQWTRPLGSDGGFFSVGPSTSTPANVTVGTNVGSFSFIWGSVDTFNSLTLNTMGGSYTYTGADIAALTGATGYGSATDPLQNPIVTFVLTGADQIGVNFNMVSDPRNAFEIDDIVVNGVPEPATWAMMLLGFGVVGVAVRRRRKVALPQLA